MDEILVYSKNILKYVENTLEKAKYNVDAIINEIIKRKRIFLVGMGRSQLVAKMFGVRLEQLGFESFLVGDPMTPPINKGDLLLAISGSGETEFTVHAAELTKRKGAKIIGITSKEDSNLAKYSDILILIPGKTKVEMDRKYPPLGTVFELSALVFLESLVMILMKKLNISEEEMKKNHANIE